MIVPDPATFNDPAQLRKLMANARRLGHTELAFKCQVRIAELAGQDYDDVLEREFWIAVTCAEEFRTQENGKTSRFSRTRQKHKRVGAKKCLEDWAFELKVTEGFQILLRHGRPDLTGEAIVVRHANRFAAETVTAARLKLEAHGVAPSSL